MVAVVAVLRGIILETGVVIYALKSIVFMYRVYITVRKCCELYAIASYSHLLSFRKGRNEF
jgi:hypothetical protein